MCSDTFGVGIHLTDEELQFVVQVPSDVDSGWTDPEAFQSLVAAAVWERLDKKRVLETVSSRYETGDTVRLGLVSLDPDGTVTDYELGVPDPGDGDRNGP